MKLKKEHFIPTLVLTAICLAAALLLAGINMLTAQRIADRENAAANEALVEVLPGGTNFKAIEVDSSYPESVKEAYSADGGYVFRVVGAGRNGEIVVMVGVDSDGKIAGVKIITSGETPKYSDPVYAAIQGESGQYNGISLDGYAPVIIAGSTLTSNGVSDAVKAALQAAAIAGGASVDLRTPEEIFQDNCNAALGTSGAVFTKWFATEVVSGIDAVYESESGRVYVIGEALVGVKNGSVTTADASEDDKAAALAADAVISASTVSKIADSELPEGMPKRLVEAYVTASGNYVIVTEGSGYGKKGDYHTSGEYIKVKVAISADGKIIDTATVYHSETADIGGVALTNPDFVDKFIGKTQQNYSSVNNVSGATLTSKGYKEAIKHAFSAFEILTGGGSTENE